MDLQEIWKKAIDDICASFQDLQQKAMLQVIGNQCMIQISQNNICFICNNELASQLLPQYAYPLLVKINQLLGDTHYGMQISMANNAINQMQPQQPMMQSADIYSHPMQNNFQNPNMTQQPFGNHQTAQNSFINQNIVQQPVINNQSDNNQIVNSRVHSDNINPDKTFENYVTDPENRLVYAIAQSIAKDPGSEAYNPFYIYGASGLGKTHILWAIANRIRQEQPNKSVVYIRAEEFIKNYVDSMAKKNFNPQQIHFQDTFTRHDVFIMDDIQSLAKGDKARETFFDIIATFLDKPGRQLILASDVPPGNLKNFSPRLVSRFGSGVCREIYPPSAETRAAIAKRKCDECGFTLPDSVIDYIANNIRSSVRELEGAVKTLKSLVDVEQRQITFDEAVKTLSNLVNSKSQTTTLDAIKDCVAKEFGVTVQDMDSASRKKLTSTARSIAMTLGHQLIPKLSSTDIGRSFNKDHSSVHEAIKRVEQRLLEDRELADLYQKLVLSLKKE